jgi:cell division protein ZapA
MPRLDVQINGYVYPVSCDDGQENRLRELAAFVDVKARALAQGRQGGAETHTLALTALFLADHIFDLKGELARLRTATHAAQVNQPSDGLGKELEAKYIAQIDELTSRIDAVASRLADV